MKKPELPQIDSIRLSALHSLNIMDTEPEERFDRITRICRHTFDVPIALVSLVDEDRQWFKSCQGLNVRQTPRDISFCGHAILGDDILIVNDTLQDERFFDNPLVTDDPKIRFYAGCPIKLHNGHKLGTLCIIDREPREFSDADKSALRDLAAMVEQEMDNIHISHTDELTKLSNSRGFKLLAPHYLKFCTREDLPASLAFIDLNKFKLINDTYGHSEGDHVLVVLADLMQTYFRQTDLVARLGGDEFVVLFSNTNGRDASNAMTSFERSLTEYNASSGKEYEITLSYGVVQYDIEKHKDIQSMLKEGDNLMYQSKKQRKLVSMMTN